jgi:hypothetical protein
MIDDRNAGVLILLDLTAAFDTVDHNYDATIVGTGVWTQEPCPQLGSLQSIWEEAVRINTSSHLRYSRPHFRWSTGVSSFIPTIYMVCIRYAALNYNGVNKWNRITCKLNRCVSDISLPQARPCAIWVYFRCFRQISTEPEWFDRIMSPSSFIKHFVPCYKTAHLII